MRVKGAAEQSRPDAANGFTLIEVLIVMAIAAVLLAYGIPALNNMLYRNQTLSTVEQSMSLIRAARLQAIKRGAELGIEQDLSSSQLLVFRETSQPPDGFTAGVDERLGSVPLPASVAFWGPADPSPNGADIADGFNQHGNNSGWVIFRANGSVDEAGAFRFGDQKGNFLEIRIDPPATARAELRKWDPSSSTWLSRREGGEPWKWD